MIGNIILHFRDNWSKSEDTFVKGRAFIGNKLFKEQQLAEFFSKASIESAVNSVNGFWGLAKKDGNSFIIVADRIRSYPLFYGVIDNIAYISDDAYWVKEKVLDDEFDEISKNEFLLTGYVTGSDTLYKNVKQLQAGEIVRIYCDKESNIKIRSSKYYNFIHGNYFKSLSREQLLKEHEICLFRTVNRLIEYAAGRTIVIPLSGGYDSRLVATAFKKMQYREVITFSYGRINNPECLISKKVAECLKYKWIFIPYDNEKAYVWYNSIERKKFSEFGDNLSTVLPDREWPAVLELKKQKLIPADSVFVPGHSGDFISGGHIPKSLYSSNINKEQFAEEILKKHYVMWKWNGVKNQWKNNFYNKIVNCAEIKLFDKKDFAANAYEKWNWQENQIKRMVNSVKIYDFFGYEYWLLLWDYEYMDFWCRVPIKYRINKNLYDEYVVKLYSLIANISSDEAEKREPPLIKNNILGKIYTNIAAVMAGKHKNHQSECELRDTDWEQSFGRLTEGVYNKLLPYIVGRSSCATLERLGYIKYTDEDVSETVIDMLKKLKDKKAL